MAIKKIKIGNEEHELQTTIANVDKLQENLDGITDKLDSINIAYATCSTAAATAAKVATVVSGTFSLVEGARVIVKFTYTNSAASPTLNVNSSGAKSIMRYGTTAASTSSSTNGWQAGAVQAFTYDGTNWVQDYWYNTTYSNVSLGQGYGTCATAAATVAKVVTLSSYSLSTGGVVSVKFTYAVPASATMNINSKGAKPIYYKGAAITADVIKAGDVATFIYNGTQYVLLSIDRWQSDIVDLQTQLDGKASSDHALSKGTDATATKSLSFGGTFTAVTDTAVSGHKITDTTTTFTMPSDRLFTTLVPTGTAITTKETDLKTTNFLKVGRYYCSQNAVAKTLKNCPTSNAFMMEVYSPLSTTIDNETTATYVYRLRKITEYNTGVQYMQYVGSGATAGTFTYADWYVVPRAKFTLDTTDTNDGSAAIGSATNPVYVASDGTLTACSRSLYAVDTAMSSTSTNPVQNKIVKAELDKKASIYIGSGDMPADCNIQIDPTAAGYAIAEEVSV